MVEKSTKDDRPNIPWEGDNAMAQAELTHPDLPNISVYLVRVTPDLAAQMLKNNSQGQRTISSAVVARYAEDMDTEDWQFNGAPIMISSDNKLLDGQHRLSAIVESKQAQLLLVVHGLNAEAMSTIDANRPRSYADILKIREVPHHANVAALTGRVWHWFHGNYGVGKTARVAKPLHLGGSPSHAQRDFWTKKIETAYEITFVAAAKFAASAAQRRKGITLSTYGLAWILLSGIDKYIRDEFFNDLLNNDLNYVRSQQCQALHNRLNNIRANEEFDNVDQLDALLTTYNAWVNGHELTNLKPPRPVRWNTLEIPKDYKEIDA